MGRYIGRYREMWGSSSAGTKAAPREIYGEIHREVWGDVGCDVGCDAGGCREMALVVVGRRRAQWVRTHLLQVRGAEVGALQRAVVRPAEGGLRRLRLRGRG